MSNQYENNDGQFQEQDAFGNPIDADSDMTHEGYDQHIDDFQDMDNPDFVDPDEHGGGAILDHDAHVAEPDDAHHQSAPKKGGMLKKVAIIGGFGVVGAAASLFMLGTFSGGGNTTSMAGLQPQAAPVGNMQAAAQALEDAQYQDMMQRQQSADMDMQAQMQAEIQRQMGGATISNQSGVAQAPQGVSLNSPGNPSAPSVTQNTGMNPVGQGDSGYRLSLSDDEPTDTADELMSDKHLNILQAALTKMTNAVDSNTQAVSEIRDLVVKQDGAIQEQRDYMDRRFAKMEQDIAAILAPGKGNASSAAQGGKPIAPVLKVEATEGTKIYTIRKGEYLTGVAQMYGLSRDEVLRLNPQITNPSLVYAGQQIRIPEGATADRNYRFAVTSGAKTKATVVEKPIDDLARWKLVAMSTDKAVLRDDQGRFYPVYVGTNVAGLGSVEAIDNRNATVTTTLGVIK